MSLYRVRVMKYYLSRMEQYCMDCSHLFILMSFVKKRISKNTITLWLRTVISEVYRTSSGGDCIEVKAKSHRCRISEP